MKNYSRLGEQNSRDRREIVYMLEKKLNNFRERTISERIRNSRTQVKAKIKIINLVDLDLETN